jgi:hypothetical protein
MESNVNKDPAGINEVIQRVSVLKHAWAAMLRGESPSTGEPATERPNALTAIAG